MTPVGRIIVLKNARKSELVQAIALITWPALTARHSTNSARLPDSQQNSEAPVKTAIDIRKMRRAPNRSPSQPDSGMKAAIV
ncbi:hypothetical protein ACC754_42395, partial [Rhizobium johnstonii]